MHGTITYTGRNVALIMLVEQRPYEDLFGIKVTEQPDFFNQTAIYKLQFVPSSRTTPQTVSHLSCNSSILASDCLGRITRSRIFVRLLVMHLLCAAKDFC